jgi:hypothetical protein
MILLNLNLMKWSSVRFSLILLLLTVVPGVLLWLLSESALSVAAHSNLLRKQADAIKLSALPARAHLMYILLHAAPLFFLSQQSLAPRQPTAARNQFAHPLFKCVFCICSNRTHTLGCEKGIFFSSALFDQKRGWMYE